MLLAALHYRWLLASLVKPMLHCTNAEDALWNNWGSRGEAARQLQGHRGGLGGVGTWPETVFGAGRRLPEGREDLPTLLQEKSELAQLDPM